MHWIDGFSLDDNLISGQSGGIAAGGIGDDASAVGGGGGGAAKGNNYSGDNNQSSAKSKRRRHAHYKLNTRLDRKSSRGMIYENEELRLRTININAEVERGQSDIKRLRRENEHLRREIWSLRDECDRLNKRFKANHGSCNARCSGGSSGGGHNRRSGGGGGGHSNSNTDDSDSCDTCRGDDQCSDDCCTDSGCRQSVAALQKLQLLADDDYADEDTNESDGAAAAAASNNGATTLHNAFDHLSVVSEETLSNSELQVPLSDGSYLSGSGYTSDLNGSQMTIPSFGPLTPLTPIELVANQLNDLQAVVPPLSYFENIVHQNHMGSTIGTTPETAAIAGAHKISRHTNGWDYNMQSPFAHLNSHGNNGNSSNSASSSSAATNSTVIHQPAAFPVQKFTTFVPSTSVTPPTAANTPDVAVCNIKHLPFLNTSNSTNNNNTKTTTTNTTSTSASLPSTSSSTLIETVAITTMPQQRAVSQATQPFVGDKALTTTIPTISVPAATSTNTNSTASAPHSSPKHFFSPLKPRLKLNTTLANNKNLTMATAVVAMAPMVPSIPVRPPVAPALAPAPAPAPCHPQSHQNCEPPDIFVANALASPYHRQPLPTIRVGTPLVTKPSSSPPPPPSSSSSSSSSTAHHHQANSMNSSIQVSPRHRHYHTKQHARDFSSQHHHHHHHRQSHRNPTIIVNLIDDLDDDDDDVADDHPIYGDNAVKEPVQISPSHLSLPKRRTLIRSSTLVEELPVACSSITKISANEPQPIYAIAQNTLKHLISAPALTHPLMATSSTTATQLPTNPRTRTGAPLIRTPTPPLIMTPTVTPMTTPRPSPRRRNSVRQKMKVSSRSVTVDTDDQTDSVNLESILNDIETISEDILAIQLDKNRSRDNLPSVGVGADSRNTTLQQQDKSKKPYRSEMNLLLSYEGANPTITPALKVADSKAPLPTNGTIQRRRTRSLEGGDHTDSPSSMPDPMAPFPDNHTYIGFEHLNSAAAGTTQTTTSLSVPITVPYSSARPPIPPAQSIPANGVGGFVNPRPAIPPKPVPPVPPARVYPPPLNIRCTGVAKSPTTGTSASLDRIAPGLSPNKSQLYASLANAAAKRAIFRSAPTHLARSLDGGPDDSETGGEQSGTDKDDTPTAGNSEQTTPSSEAAKRKAARRVSILCNENGGIILTSPDATTSTGTTATTTMVSAADNRISSPASTGANTTPSTTTITTSTLPLTTGSYSDLPSMNPTLRYLKQMQSHSTPSSPHSGRRRTNSNTMDPSKLATPSGNTNSLPPGQSTMTLAINQQQQQQPRKSSGQSAELAAAAAIVARSRCSRRHSDGTVVGGNAVQQQRHSGGGTSGNHHHHHHHHQHSSSLVGHNNPHHSHHSRQDSNHETATSLSDRNSNSLASSRESSTSFSMRSQRRKISVSSHAGGKIPWCGCWGNGCL